MPDRAGSGTPAGAAARGVGEPILSSGADDRRAQARSLRSAKLGGRRLRSQVNCPVWGGAAAVGRRLLGSSRVEGAVALGLSGDKSFQLAWAWARSRRVRRQPVSSARSSRIWWAIVSICLSSVLKTRDAHGAGLSRVEDRRRRAGLPASGGAKMRSILGVPLVLEAARPGMAEWDFGRGGSGSSRKFDSAYHRVFVGPHPTDCVEEPGRGRLSRVARDPSWACA